MRIISPGYANTNVAALYAAASGGLLDGSESDGTNLLSGGQLNFTSDWGSLNGTLTANNVTSPAGTTTAATFLEYATNDRHGTEIYLLFLLSTSTQYKFSVYAKQVTTRYLQLAAFGTTASSGPYAFFDLQTGTVSSSGTNNPDGATNLSSVTCEAAVNGYYKCTVIGTVDSVSNAVYLKLYGSSSGSGTVNFPTYTGNTSNGFNFWRPKITT